MPLAALFQARAQFVLTLRPSEEPLGKCAQVEARSAGDDGQFDAPGDLPERRSRGTAVGARGERLIRVGDIDQVVW